MCAMHHLRIETAQGKAECYLHLSIRLQGTERISRFGARQIEEAVQLSLPGKQEEYGAFLFLFLAGDIPYSFVPIPSFHQFTPSYLFACEYQPMYCFEMNENAVFHSYQLVVDVLIRGVDRNNKKLTETNTGKYQLLGSFFYQYYDDFWE